MPSFQVISFTAVILAISALSQSNAFVTPPSTSITSPSTSTRSVIVEPLWGLLNPNKRQKEQLDKYGATPETGMEMLFDTLVEAPDWMVHAVSGGNPEWKKLIKGLRQQKRDKKEKKREQKLAKQLEAEAAASDEDGSMEEDANSIRNDENETEDTKSEGKVSP